MKDSSINFEIVDSSLGHFNINISNVMISYFIRVTYVRHHINQYHLFSFKQETNEVKQLTIIVILLSVIKYLEVFFILIL